MTDFRFQEFQNASIGGRSRDGAKGGEREKQACKGKLNGSMRSGHYSVLEGELRKMVVRPWTPFGPDFYQKHPSHTNT
jgi:hypothetical protein